MDYSTFKEIAGDTPIEDGLTPFASLLEWLKDNSLEVFKNRIKEKVLGQDDEIDKAATLIYAFLSSISKSERNDYHFLLEGVSGCGKTTFAKALRDILPCPVLIIDSSQIFLTGYKGVSINKIVSDYDLREWQGFGVIFLDEIDKMIQPRYDTKDNNISINIQHELLKMLDGGDIYDDRGNKMSTDKTLIIGTGAFSDTPKKGDVLTMEDIEEFGGSHQLLGRFIDLLHFKNPDYCVYKKIGEEVIEEIKDIYPWFEISEDELEEVVKNAIKDDFGVRSVRNLIWREFLSKEKEENLKILS